MNSGGNLTFTATPSPGYLVNSWSVDGTVTQTGGTTFTLANITANHTVNVTFSVATFTITPSAGVNGTINPNTAQTADYGTNMTFTASPGTGYTIDTWSVDGTGAQTGGTTFTLANITANHTLSVTFAALSFTITPYAGANGQISPNTPQGAAYNTNITFTATPTPGYYIVTTWLLDGVPVQNGGTTYTLANVTANHIVSVTFGNALFTITPSSDSNGSISLNTPQAVGDSTSLLFIATPNAGFGVNIWSVDGTLAQTGGTTFTLANITQDHTVSVTFIASP